MDFDEAIERRGTHSVKWDGMESRYGVSPDTGIPMWVADTDFRAPDVVLERLREAVGHGVLGYVDCDQPYAEAIRWWMSERHGWEIEPEWIFTTTGIVNAIGVCLDAFTAPGDGVVVFSPVYHAFARVVRAAERDYVEMPLVNVDGRYEMDFDSYDSAIPENARMVILCSPHNPGGRTWTRAELKGVAAFCKRHDLVLVSDEIHHDLVMPGCRHLPMPLVDPSLSDRLVMLTAPSKTFNLAGLHTGNAIIADPDLRARFDSRIRGLSIAPNSLGQFAATAAYSPEGAKWVDAQMEYIDGNRRIFDSAIEAIPGVSSMPLEATYLAWVDFSGTGMARDEFASRVMRDAQIAANLGETFGKGGESYLRFNLGTRRSVIEDACERLTKAFADLQ